MDDCRPGAGGDLRPGPQLVRRLAAAGFVAAQQEAAQLAAAADRSGVDVAGLVERRLTGEPLAWITGRSDFGGLALRIDPGVYVPRPRTVALARRGVTRLPPGGVAIDVCTGAGAIAATLARTRASARVVASDLHAPSVACARSNGVEAHLGDLFDPVPDGLRGRVDLVIGSVPYVPTAAMSSLQRDTFTFETTTSYDGGEDGLDVVRRVLRDARSFLRPGGWILLELGGEQPDALADDLARLGYGEVTTLREDEGEGHDVVWLEAAWTGGPGMAH